MFTNTTIATAASGLVGFSHSYHPFYTRLTTGLKSASSGYYVNALPGVTFDVIENTIMDEVMNTSLVVDEYYEIRDNSGGASFTGVGAANNNVGTVFKATGASPTWGTGRLKLVSCNTYLANIYNQELLHLVSTFVDKCKGTLNTKEILSNQHIIHGVMKRDEKVDKQGRFVGFLLNPMASQNVKSKITYLGLMLDTAQSLTVYLYETSRNTAVKSYSFVLSSGDTVEWKAVTDWIVQYATTSGGIGQQWLLGYYEDDLTGQAYKQDFDDESRHEAFKVYGRYLGVSPVAIPSTALNGTSLPDNDSWDQYITDEMHGLYFKFNTTCDITNVLVDNISIFSRPLQHAIAIRVLEDAYRSGSDGVHNPVKDSNLKKWQEHANVLKGQLYGGFDANGVFHKGMVHYLSIDFSNLDKICLKKKDTELRVYPIV